MVKPILMLRFSSSEANCLKIGSPFYDDKNPRLRAKISSLIKCGMVIDVICCVVLPTSEALEQLLGLYCVNIPYLICLLVLRVLEVCL